MLFNLVKRTKSIKFIFFYFINVLVQKLFAIDLLKILIMQGWKIIEGLLIVGYGKKEKKCVTVFKISTCPASKTTPQCSGFFFVLS